jgi:hypothetical protein
MMSVGERQKAGRKVATAGEYRRQFSNFPGYSFNSTDPRAKT